MVCTANPGEAGPGVTSWWLGKAAAGLSAAGLAAIPAVIREVNDSAMAAMALIENLQQENLDYFEEAEGYQRLLEEFGLTQEVLAQRSWEEPVHHCQ